MGCTSSAQNMAPSLKNTVSDRENEDFGEMIETSIKSEAVSAPEIRNDTNGFQVLPTCDTLGESAQLDRNNKSIVDMTSHNLKEDKRESETLEENSDGNRINTDTGSNDIIQDSEEKLSKLEEVVEKVVELYVENHLDNNVMTKLDELSNNAPTADPNLQERTTNDNVDNEEIKDDENEELEQVASPSQSQSSRATRWEALADIAAELPPSLAVDPVTGQIYSLSK